MKIIHKPNFNPAIAYRADGYEYDLYEYYINLDDYDRPLPLFLKDMFQTIEKLDSARVNMETEIQNLKVKVDRLEKSPPRKAWAFIRNLFNGS